ncbi:MAG: hypothetical protein JJE05_06180 [Actinobacteria bacterium]|nr:hypothetical protein [Actinomycetota bacterium]
MAQSLSGGCSATINGKTPTQLTKDAPLVVAEGDNVVLKGTAPSSVTGGRSSTRVKVETPVWLPDMSFGPYKGKGAAWGGTVEVPKILFTLGSGIYKVNGTATGTGGWRCTGSAYVQLGDSSPIEAAAGGAAALGGGAIALSGRKPKNKNSLGRAIVNLIKELGPEIKATFGADGFLLLALLLLFVLLGILELPG